MKKILALLLTATMLFGLLAACADEKAITAAEAQAIVLEEMGISASDATVHVHEPESEDLPCYMVYVTYNSKTTAYIVDAATGEILDTRESDHSH